MGDSEELAPRLRYPFHVIFIIGNEFCERFNYYGMRAVLVIYLNRILHYSQNTSTVIYHIFTMLVYTTCIFGAFLADAFLGKYRTILFVSLIYVTGSVTMALGAIGKLGISQRVMAGFGLLLIAIGSGGIKPCTAAFGGDQFRLPEQTKQMSTFFSIFYFAINAGALLSTVLTPIFREDVYCFGKQHCYSLAFGVPAILMCCAVVIFNIGRLFYTMKPPVGNQTGRIGVIIGHALVRKYKNKSADEPKHFLEYAAPKYGRQAVEDIKAFLRILVLYIPMPFFWALFDQQGSRWTFQATMMNCEIGGGVELKPEHMLLVNPLLILALIPIFEFGIYPLLALCGIKRPLQKIFLGGILAAAAFLISGFLELALRPTYGEPLEPGLAQLRVFNAMPNCDYSVKTDLPEKPSFKLPAMSHYEDLKVPVKDSKDFTYTLSSESAGCEATSGKFRLKEATATSYLVKGTADDLIVHEYNDKPEKSRSGKAHIRVLRNTKQKPQVSFVDMKGNEFAEKDGEMVILDVADYTLHFGSKKLFVVKARAGDVFTILIADEGHMYRVIPVAPERTISVLWQLPQYTLITAGEVLYSVTGLQFTYSQAPISMKSVLQACWLLTVALGNLIVVVIARMKFFDNVAYEFFLFGILMIIDMLLLMVLAILYVPYDPTKVHANDDDADFMDEHTGYPYVKEDPSKSNPNP